MAEALQYVSMLKIQEGVRLRAKKESKRCEAHSEYEVVSLVLLGILLLSGRWGFGYGGIEGQLGSRWIRRRVRMVGEALPQCVTGQN